MSLLLWYILTGLTNVMKITENMTKQNETDTVTNGNPLN